ncbi:DUF4236 domain-containing protein [Cellulomonas humilata]|uniref:DUF4236 domain-containing protein n=1 Tax=Cellulomonas humilata TaxID=144055 RepID=A0A7Y6DYW4_9CELL|nr:DUF4236 domain-containing protein [Cellulomonas humilata]NUU19043.1 DUF4236 domain-containing protein [Cellulomonas humilata]
MGFRARKSFKVMPGVRMTVTPRGVSTSVGVRGARVSAHSSGRVTRSVGIPGSGVSYTTSTSGSARATPAAQSRPAAGAKPGFTAPKWEKALYAAAIVRQDPAEIRQVATAHAEPRPLAAVLEAMLGAMPADDDKAARDLLAWAWAQNYDPGADPFVLKYLPAAGMTLTVAAGITVTMPLSRDAIGLALAEAHQSVGDLAAAVSVVESLEPSTIAAVSLAELYADQERWDEVITLTDGVTNLDEPSMFMLVQRAIALRHLGSPGASREALKEALRLRSRPAELRHLALVERAYTYLAEGKTGMARRDLDKVLAEDANYPGLSDAIAQLPSD